MSATGHLASYRIVGDSHNQTRSVPHGGNGDTLMLNMDIIYPDGVSTSAEERAFDSFLLSYITEQALKQAILAQTAEKVQ